MAFVCQRENIRWFSARMQVTKSDLVSHQATPEPIESRALAYRAGWSVGHVQREESSGNKWSVIYSIPVYWKPSAFTYVTAIEFWV